MTRHNALWSEHVSTTLTSPQYAVLVALCEHDDWDQRSVSEWVGLDKATGGEVIARLVSRGLVVRRRDEHDRRRYVLALTEEGYRTLEELSAGITEFMERLVVGLSADEQRMLDSLLAKLVL